MAAWAVHRWVPPDIGLPPARTVGEAADTVPAEAAAAETDFVAQLPPAEPAGLDADGWVQRAAAAAARRGARFERAEQHAVPSARDRLGQTLVQVQWTGAYPALMASLADASAPWPDHAVVWRRITVEPLDTGPGAPGASRALRAQAELVLLSQPLSASFVSAGHVP